MFGKDLDDGNLGLKLTRKAMDDRGHWTLRWHSGRHHLEPEFHTC